MTTAPTRPTTDAADVLLESMDRMFTQLIGRLDGLASDEYLWEPVDAMWSVRLDKAHQPVVDDDGVRDIEPAPVTTIAWRLWHISMRCFDDYTRRFSGEGGDVPLDWPMDPREAVEILQKKWLAYRDSVSSRGWADQLGDSWGPWSKHCVADMAMHASNELVHHGAEIALLRDLYRASFANESR